MNYIGDNVRFYRELKNLTQDELAELSGLTRQSIGMLERGNVKRPKLVNLMAIAKVLDTTVEKLKAPPSFKSLDIKPTYQNTNKRYVKVLGSVPAGLPQEAYENDTGEVIEVDEDFITNNNELIALTVTGDSMYPRFIEGDIIILEVTNNYKNGDIVIATINDYETTLKQIYTNGNITTLHPINPEYPDRRYSFEHDRLSIFGVVRELRRKV